ncbi:hypothetical protein [Salinimicrobium xinjiangense]|uniref:hypothetical protein n=1 Tax=Salinimicrobium xinjiangense TaxID=438596 RepID=UPI0012EC2CB2|nr:hypothetical protein [Salinimicrobium xinjiangense]
MMDFENSRFKLQNNCCPGEIQKPSDFFPNLLILLVCFCLGSGGGDDPMDPPPDPPGSGN